MIQFSATGIILRRIDYGEADRIITFLSSEQGKILVMAKGVRKQKSKLAGGIELFSVSELHCIKGKKDIDTLTSSRLINYYSNIVKDYDRTELGYKMLKIIDKTVEDGSGHDYFDMLNESLAALDSDKISLHLAEASFIMRNLQFLGHMPDFSVGKSGKQLDQDVNFEFDFESVNFVEAKDGPYNKNHLKVLKLLAYNSPQKVAAVQGIGKLTKDLKPLLVGLSNYYLPGIQ